MRTRRVGWLLLTAAMWVAAENRVQGPVLGYVFDETAHRVRPILGIAGTSATGSVLDWGVDLAQVAASPMQNYLLGLKAGTGEALVLVPGDAVNPVRTIAEVAPGADRILISPRGAAAAFYYTAANKVQVLTGLPDAPAAAGVIDLSVFQATLGAAAVSDDGSLLAVIQDGLYSFGPDGSVDRLTDAAGVVAAAFLPSSSDAIVASAGGVTLIRDVLGSAVETVLFQPAGSDFRPVGAAASQDGQRAFVADAAGGGVLVFGLSAGTAAFTACNCTPSGLDVLDGVAVFRLTDPATGPVTLLDAGGDQPRVLAVPPAADQGGRQ